MNHQWPPEVTRAMHQFSDAAPVAPSLTTVLEHRPTTASSRPPAARLEPPQHLVPTEEINVTVNTHTSETRNRRCVLMAAAAVVVVIGVAGIALLNNGADDDQTPAATTVPTVAPTTVAPTTTVATETFSFAVDSANDIPVTFTAPETWSRIEGWAAFSGSYLGDGSFALFDGSITNVYTDGCQWTLLDPPVGPTVDDLVAAWADVPELAATAAVDITVDGYAGKQIEFTVPDYTPSECREEKFGIYMLDGAVPPGQWALDPGANEHWQMLVLDVDGTRLLIAASTFPNTSPEHRAELEEVLASIQIG